jgi:exodeoxyribonuclease VIII
MARPTYHGNPMKTLDAPRLPAGIHPDVPFADYLALEAWGSSSLKAMRRGPPARVLHERDAGHGDTPATILGTAVHCALLTPDLYARQYAVKPEGMSFATKDGKAWRDDPERAGRILLSHDVGATVDAIVASLLRKPEVAKSLDKATHREVSLVWECSKTGELCKARPDWMDAGHIYDLKVSRHAQHGDLLGTRAYFDGWFHQGAHYRTGAVEVGIGLVGSRLVVVDPVAPHFVYTLDVDTEALDVLEWENMETLRKLRECRTTGAYPGTPEGWKRIKLPGNVLAQMGDSFDSDGEEETEEAI